MCMKIKKVLSVFILASLLVSCATPARLYKNGEYYKATIASVKRLRSKPDDIKVQDILTKTYSLAIDYLQQSINDLQYEKDPNKYYSIVKYYNMLNTMANEIMRCPKAYELIPEPIDFVAELQAAKETGAEEFYSLGIEALEQNDVKQARLALFYFDNANNFIRGYKDINSMTKEAQNKSILKVAVQKPLISTKYQLSSDFFFDNLLEGLNNANYRNRVDFFGQSSRSTNNNAHQIIILDFVDFTVGNTMESRKIIDCKRDSVITDYVNIRGQSYPVYNTVRARFIETDVEIVSAGILSVQVIDSKTKKVIRKSEFRGRYIWASTWATYEGDQRALNQRQIDLYNRGIEIPPPPQTLFVEFTKPIYAQTIDFLTDYYYHY